MDTVKLLMAKAGLPESEAVKFFHYYESNGWRVGRNPMKSVSGAVGHWKSNYEERRFVNGGAKPVILTPDHSKGF